MQPSRARCHRSCANRLRLLPAKMAQTPKINLRRHTLAGTGLAQACAATIRTKPLKMAATIVRITRHA